jgi:predicted O-methyltransferase YrrM
VCGTGPGAATGDRAARPRLLSFRSMDATLQALLADLFADGTSHDGAEPDRLRRRRNLEPESAALLTLVLRIAGARDVVEIGTSNGYSAIWLADALRDTGGRLSTVDVEEWPGVAANIERSGLASHLERRIGDGGAILAGYPDASVDLLFLDAERVEYAGWWPHPARVLRPGGVLAVDNVLSHPDEVAEFLGLVAGHGGFVGETLAVGKGLFLAWLRAEAPRPGQGTATG